MSAKELRSREASDMQSELIKLRREQFSLRMQSASGQAVKSSDFGKVKKSIARVKTVMREKVLSSKVGGARK